MWEDITVVVACLGFTTALVLIAVEVRGLIVDVRGERTLGGGAHRLP